MGKKKIIINIGRQFGCGAKDVAVVLGEKLGIQVYDGELINKAAQESGLSPELFKKCDEKKLFSLSSMLTIGYYTENVTSYSNLFKIQSETILKIADDDSAIIVGRCADYILREHENCLNVFLTSPLEKRMKRACERNETSPEEAENFVSKKDRDRADYYNQFTLGNWGHAETYDLCIDSSILGIEGTADFIIDFARRAGLLKD